MPPKCSICSNPRCDKINEALVARQPLRDIARQLATGKDALQRHRAHIPGQLLKAQRVEEIASADTLLEKTQGLLSRATRLADQAEHAKNLSAALRGVREIRGVLELLGRVSGELQSRSQTNVGVSIQQQIDLGNPGENERRIAELLSKAGMDYVPRHNLITVDMLDGIINEQA